MSATSATSTGTAPPALTTVFTPASSCLVDIWQYSATESGLECIVGSTQVQCNYVQLGPSQTSSCFPSGWDYESTAYFSPGICPSGYETACSSVTTFGTNTETRATCCPSGYSCQTGTDWPWYSTDPCTYYNAGPVTYVYTTSMPGEGTVTATTTGNEGFNAYGVQIRFQASDSVTALTATTASTTTSSTTSSTTAATISSSSSTAAAASTSSSSTGLSTGAKAGIGVGVAVAGLIIIASILFFFLRRRRYSAVSADSNELPGEPAATAHSAELATPTNTAVPFKQEIYSQPPRSELHGEALRSELE